MEKKVISIQDTYVNTMKYYQKFNYYLINGIVIKTISLRYYEFEFYRF